MPSKTHTTNEKYRKLGLVIGNGSRIWGVIDTHTLCVTIGRFVTLAEKVFVATHCPVKGASLEKLKVVIGNDTWIGYRSSVAPGTNIGSRVLVGIGSVVAGKLSSDSIYVGNPAKKIGTRNPIEVMNTRLYTRQGLTSTPQTQPTWDVTNADILDVFEDLLFTIPKDVFSFLLDEAFCRHILISDDTIQTDNIKDMLNMLNKMYEEFK